MRRLVLLLALVLLPSFAFAQVVDTGPVTTTMKIAWDQPANVILADAATFEYRLKNNGTLLATLSSVSCVAGSTVPTCTAPVTQALADQVNKVGVQQLTLTLFRADVGESAASLPFSLRSPAAAPGSLKIIR
jgi:hypothetical protein